MDVLVDSLSARRSQLEALNRLSLYPSEELLWDQYQVPVGNTFTSDRPLALPKLNLQFLTVHDYLLRNFELFRLESAFEIREDLIDAVRRMGPRSGLKGNTVFGGWARMAQPVASVSIDEVTSVYFSNHTQYIYPLFLSSETRNSVSFLDLKTTARGDYTGSRALHYRS